MKKRFLASLLALGMLLTMVTGAAWAAEETAISISDFATLKNEIEGGKKNFVLAEDISISENTTWSDINIALAGHTNIGKMRNLHNFFQ